MTTTRKPAEVPFERIELMFRLAGYYLSGNYKPPVFKDGAGYGIWVLALRTSTPRTTTTSYGYFEISADGIVTASPRGWAREFNRKRITSLPEALEKYATPDAS